MLFIVCSKVAFAQEMELLDTVNGQKLNEIVVTATRTARQLSSLPLPISIITATEISKTGANRNHFNSG
jgi:outer membrane receptor for ferrienterochelin and colicins